MDIYRINGHTYATDPTTGHGETAKRPPILVKGATRTAIAHAHGYWSKGYNDEKGSHVTGRARDAAHDDFKSGEPSGRDRETARTTTVYTSTPAHEGWKQTPSDKEPQRFRPMRDSNDKPASAYRELKPEEVEKMELPPGFKGTGVPPMHPE